MSRVFLTTRYTDDIYRYIVSLCIKDTKFKKKDIKILKIQLSNTPDLFFFTGLFKVFTIREILEQGKNNFINL
tara:strand:+ start:220 stop:438 length:219 start_codon:yes stop_codon:yes gene_type:complete